MTEEERRKKISDTKLKQWKEYCEKYPYPKEGHRPCSVCGEVKYFNIEDKHVSEFYAVKNGSKTVPHYVPDSWCKMCKRKADQANRAKKLQKDPEGYKARKREIDRNYRERDKDRYRAQQRAQGHRARRRKGIEPRKWKDTSPQVRVDAEPFRQWVLSNEIGPEDYFQIHKGHERTGKMLNAVMRGEQETLSLDWVDRVLIGCNGPHLSELYPNLYSFEE
jgi:hypothetical protein